MTFLMLLAMPLSSLAACSSKWAPQTTTGMNEYYSFGSQFLEIYSTAKTFPSTWYSSGLTIEVYKKSGSSIAKNSYTFSDANAFACTKTGKTWLTMPNVTGLTNGEGMAVLKDSTGIVDAFAFFNGGNVSNLEVWLTDSNNWYNTYNGTTSLGCTALSNALTAQSTKIRAGTSSSELNFVNASSSNKGLARYPDGVSNPWTDTDQTGAGSTFTTCTSNNANLIKTVDRATAPPNATVRFSLTVANSSTSSLTGGTITITDTLPTGMVFVSATSSLAGGTLSVPSVGATSGTITWTPATIVAKTQAVLTVTMTVPATASIGTIYTNTASASGSAVSKPQSDSASVTVIAPTTPSFLVSSNRQTACVGSTVGTSTPVITLTAKDQADGTGNTLTSYNKTVTLNSSSSTTRWALKTGAGGFNQVGSGGSYTFSPSDLGIATFYLTDTVAENVDLSVYDYTTFAPSDMTGVLSPITYSSAGSCSTLPLVSIASKSFSEGNADAAQTFTVSLTNATTGAAFVATSAVTVNFSTVSGTAIAGTGTGFDLTAVTNGTITIPIGSSSGTASVTIKGDTNFEGDETFQVVLSSPVNAQLGVTSAVGTILNDDSPTIRAKYTMDEASWTTGAQSALDSSGNNLHATIRGTLTKATTSPAYSSATTGVTTCGYGIFDAAATSYLELPTNLQTLPATGREGFTITGWIKPNSGSGEQPIIAVSGDWSISLTGSTLSFSKTGLTFTSVVGGTMTTDSISTSTVSLSSGTWHYFALSLDTSTKTAVLYTYPATTGSTAFSNRVTASYSATWVAPTSGTVAVGGTPSGTTNFNGRLDEINIYDDTLSQSMVEQIRMDTRSCGCTLGSFRITQTATALACPDTRATVSVEPMCTGGTTVKADYAGTVTLSAAAPNTSNASYYSAATSGAVITSLTFVAGELSKNAYLDAPNEIAGVCTTASDGSISSTSASCTNFHAYGFKVSAQPTEQVCGSSQTISLTAYGKNPVSSSGQSCATITGFSGNKNLKAWFTSGVDPDNVLTAQASNRTLSITGSASGIANKTLPTSSNLINVPFTNGVGSLSISYPNAAKIFGINFQHDESPYTNTSSPCTAAASPLCPLTAVTDGFLAYPNFVVSITDSGAECTAADPSTCPVFRAAGASFNMQVAAQCLAGAAAPASDYVNRSLPTSLQQIKLSISTLVAPLTGIPGTVGISDTNITSGGAVTVAQTWSEVGVAKFSAEPPTWFGKSFAAVATTNPIGRFTPHHFDTAVTGPMTCSTLFPTVALSSSCPDYKSPTTGDSLSNQLTYSGQAFQVKVTAMGPNAKTANYFGDFAKNITLAAYSGIGGATLSTSTGSLTAGSTIAKATFTTGEATSTTTTFAFTSWPTATSGTPTPAIPANIYIRAIDADNVSSLRAPDPTTTSVEGGIRIVSGKLRIDNMYGAKSAWLPVLVNPLYYTGSAWVSNPAMTLATTALALDSTTACPSGDYTGLASALLTPVPATGTRSNYQLLLASPSFSTQTSRCINLNSTLTYLPGSGRVTWGSFRAPYIYQRER